MHIIILSKKLILPLSPVIIMKKTLWIIFWILVVAWLIYWVNNQQTPTEQTTPSVVTKTKKDTKITIAMVTFPWYAPFYVADEMDLWPEGFDVDLIRIESLGDMRTAMKAWKIDMYAWTYDMFLATEWTEPVWKAVLALDESTWWDWVAVVWWVKSLQDLVWAKVTAEAWLPPHFMLMYALYNDGLSLDDIDFQDVPSADAWAAFIAKQADIVWTYEPYLSNAVESRDWAEILLSSADTPWLIVDFLWASDEAIEWKEKVTAVVEGWYAALDYHKNNQDASYEIMWDAFWVDAEEMAWFETWITWLWEEENSNLFDVNNKDSAYVNYTTVQDVLVKNWVDLYPTKAEDKIIWDFIKTK